MQYIKKIKLINFKKFKNFEATFKKNINTIIGDNEAGKSSILQAIELVASGSRIKVETAGIESILNADAVTEFLAGERSYKNLPEIHVEVHLNDEKDPDLHGKNNTDKISASGLHMICQPNEDLAGEIDKLLKEDKENFPFEYYTVKFITFSGEAYSGYRRLLRCLTIDSSAINSEHANTEYIKTVYQSFVDDADRISLNNAYRKRKSQFTKENLNHINNELKNYEIAVRSDTKHNLETDITLLQENIPIDKRGKGKQCFIKTEFALMRNNEKNPIHTLLLEEPENHLSHTNMKRLISKISESHKNQIIIATHSSLIATRLDLRNALLINSSCEQPITLSDLSPSTAKFFIKAPDNNILEFVLSQRVLLVEGNAEYILMNALYQNSSGKSLEEANIHVISVGGISFKRYMELAKKLKIKTAVIRDNDKDYQTNCVDNYTDYVSKNIQVFSDKNNDNYTFEVCLYKNNKNICEDLFAGKKSALQFMLDNKSESALRLLDQHSNDLKVPEYIREAFAWISE